MRLLVNHGVEGALELNDVTFLIILNVRIIPKYYIVKSSPITHGHRR